LVTANQRLPASRAQWIALELRTTALDEVAAPAPMMHKCMYSLK
jgi:hypothetical protein